MRRNYAKPSMAVNAFDTEDHTNVTPLSTVAQIKGTKNAERIGMSVFNLKN